MHPYTNQSQEELIAENIRLREELANKSVKKKEPLVWRYWHMMLLTFLLSLVSMAGCAIAAQIAYIDRAGPVYIIPSVFFGVVGVICMIWSVGILSNFKLSKSYGSE